jgi:hypothetical protein
MTKRQRVVFDDCDLWRECGGNPRGISPNWNVRSCLKLTFSNGRLLTILLILVVSLVSQIVKGKADLGLFKVILLPLAMILGLIWFNLSRSLVETATAISASGAQRTIDTQGMTTTLVNQSTESLLIQKEGMQISREV